MIDGDRYENGAKIQPRGEYFRRGILFDTDLPISTFTADAN